MSQESMSIVENGNAAMLNSKNGNTIVFESGNAYRLYGRTKENKVKHIGECSAPNFDQWDEYHFQKQYSYLGVVKIVKVKRTLKIQIN